MLIGKTAGGKPHNELGFAVSDVYIRPCVGISKVLRVLEKFQMIWSSVWSVSEAMMEHIVSSDATLLGGKIGYAFSCSQHSTEEQAKHAFLVLFLFC